MRQSAIVPGWKPPSKLVIVVVSLAAAMACSLAFQSADASAYSVDVYRNSASISLPGNGNASTYPSTINVPPTPGHIIGVTVTFHGFSHGSAQSVNALLMAPDGSTSLVMTGSCTTTVPLSTFVFSEQAPTTMPKFAPCDKPAYRPTENTPDGWVDFGPGAPYGPYSANSNNFIRGPAGGAWKLFIKGYGGAKSGSISGGWSLTIETSDVDALVPAMDPSGANGPGDAVPAHTAGVGNRRDHHGCQRPGARRLPPERGRPGDDAHLATWRHRDPDVGRLPRQRGRRGLGLRRREQLVHEPRGAVLLRHLQARGPDRRAVPRRTYLPALYRHGAVRLRPDRPQRRVAALRGRRPPLRRQGRPVPEPLSAGHPDATEG